MNKVYGPDTLPAAEIQGATQLFDWLAGPVRWSLLAAGLELKVFDHLTDPVDADTLAQTADLSPDSLLPWLRGLAAMGVMEYRAEGWALMPGLAPFLTSSGGKSLVPTLQHLARLRHGSVSDLVARLRFGPQTSESTPFQSEAFWTRAGENLKAFHQALAAPLSADLLRDLPFWPDVRSMLDVGAGSDSLGRRLLIEQSTLTVTLFDLPGCIHQMQALGEPPPGLYYRAGDYNRDTLGTDHDLIWCAMSLYYADDRVALCKRFRQALNPGGWLVSLHEGLTHDRTRPAGHVVARSWPAIQGMDVSFNAGEIAHAMEQAGFTEVTRRRVAMPYGEMELTMGQSPSSS